MWRPSCHSKSQYWIHGSFLKRAITHDPFLKHQNKNNAQFNKMAMTNAEEIGLPSKSMTNQAIRLFLNLSYKALHQWVMPETGDLICPSNVLTDTTSSSNQAPLCALCSFALKSLFLTSRHLPFLYELCMSNPGCCWTPIHRRRGRQDQVAGFFCATCP